MFFARVLLAQILVVGALRERKARHTASSLYVQKTRSGCECRTPCTTSLANKYQCEYCLTKGRCGKLGLTGRRDVCSYPVQEDFEAKTAEQKLEHVWAKVTSDIAPTPRYYQKLELAQQFMLSVHTTFDNWMPEMPEGRKKIIHTIGSVCKVNLKITDSPYTGLLAVGTHQGFVRMGSAGGHDSSFTPGVAFKFPRSGVPDGNFVSMTKLGGGMGWNFFAGNMSNHIANSMSPLQFLGGRKFAQATLCSNMVGLSDMAKFGQCGKKEPSPKAPYKVFLMPQVSTTDTPQNPDSLASQFSSFKAGTTLFKVYGCDTPTDTEELGPLNLDNCGGATLMGTLDLASKCVSSGWGDKHMFFRHTRIEEDWALRPEFKEGAKKACGLSEEGWNQGSPIPCTACMRGDQGPRALCVSSPR